MNTDSSFDSFQLNPTPIPKNKVKKFLQYVSTTNFRKRFGYYIGSGFLVLTLITGVIAVKYPQIFLENAQTTTTSYSHFTTFTPCRPLQRRCVTGSGSTPKIEVCRGDGLGYSAGYNCQPGTVCDSTGTDCALPITSTLPTGTCINGRKMCYGGQTMVCFDHEWMFDEGNRLNCPKPPASTNTYDCKIKNGYPVCTQTNPLWANNPFPHGCSNLNQNQLYKVACGYATTCSMICNCKKTAEFCNLDKCLHKDPLLSGYANCGGTGLKFTKKVLDQYPECFSTTDAKPDTTVHNQITNENVPGVSWDKINELLKAGPVQVYGTFKYTAPNGDSYTVEHISLIVGVDANGKHIFNDTYFNPENPDPKLRVTTSKLEDVMNIQITDAVGINN